MNSTITDTLLTSPAKPRAASLFQSRSAGEAHSALFVQHLSRLNLATPSEDRSPLDSAGARPDEPRASHADETHAGAAESDQAPEEADAEAGSETDEAEASASAESEATADGEEVSSEASAEHADGDAEQPSEDAAPKEAKDAAPMTVRMLNALLLSGKTPEQITRGQALAQQRLDTQPDPTPRAETPPQTDTEQTPSTNERASQAEDSEGGSSRADARRVPAGTAASEHGRTSETAGERSARHPQSAAATGEHAAERATAAAQASTVSAGAPQASANAAPAAAQGAINASTAAKNSGASSKDAPAAQPTALDPAALAKAAGGGRNNGSTSSNSAKDQGAFSAHEGQQGANPASSRANAAETAFSSQVTRGVLAAINQRGGSVTIRLSPEHLGPMRLHVKLKEGSISARFETSNDSARDLLTRSIDMLRTTLEDRGYTVESLRVHAAEPHENTPTFGQLREHEGRSGFGGDGSSEHGRSFDDPSHDPGGNGRPWREDAPERTAALGNGRLGEPPGSLGGWGGNGLPSPLTEWSRVKLNIPIAHAAEPAAQSIDALA